PGGRDFRSLPAENATAIAAGLLFPEIFQDTAFELNTMNPVLQELYTNMLKYWIAEVDLDGYRLTAASHVTADFTAYLSTHLRFYASALGKENFFIVGEVNQATTPFGESYLGRVQGREGPRTLPKKVQGVLEELCQLPVAKRSGAGRYYSALPDQEPGLLSSCLARVVSAGVILADWPIRPSSALGACDMKRPAPRWNPRHGRRGTLLVMLMAVVPMAFVVPEWWRQGWPRQQMNSMAEAELLSQVAALLMLDSAPLEEMFRNFPAPEGWGGNYLEPDLSLYGVLKDEDAALFVEYDGYWRHEEKEGMEKDMKKNAALLTYAPAGSYVIRISHTTNRPLQGNVLWVKADTWTRGEEKSLSTVLMDIFVQLKTSGFVELVHPRVRSRLDSHTCSGSSKLSLEAQLLVHATVVVGSGNTTDEISHFLSAKGFSLQDCKLMQQQGVCCGTSIERTLQPKIHWLSDLGLTKSQVAKAVATHPLILGYSIDQNLKPTVQWLSDLGLTKSQVAKAVATSPQILGYSIDQNLKPTVQWLSYLGLTKSQVAKAVATSPRILGLSIDQNLKPTVRLFLELGLTKSQVAKAVATYPPILWCSIDQNLQPTVQWFLELGLTKSQVAKAVANFPQILGLSIDQNLKPKIHWLSDLGLTKSQVAKAVATSPQILSYSIDQNLKPKIHWLSDLGLTKSQVAKAVATFPQILGYSIDQNLKPTVQWLSDLGLTKSQIAKAVATSPQILGYSIDQNLKPTVQWLSDLGLTKSQVAKAVATSPQILGYSIDQNLKRKIHWLSTLGLTKSQVAKAVATFPQILGLSIDQNLKPTVQWLSDLGLTKSQVAKAVANFPPVLGLSIHKNLKNKVKLLQWFLTPSRFVGLVAQCPRIFSYSQQRLEDRVHVLSKQGSLGKLRGAMSLTEEAFHKRFVSLVVRNKNR
ncbi:unnamed protein product, partial [Cladocopium goreaui]